MYMPKIEFDCLPDTEIPDVTGNQLLAIHLAAYADSAAMTEEAWEEVRRGGLGGSDIAALTGDSPFNTNWTIFLDKARIARQDMSENWFRLKYGHLNEPLVAELFARKFSAKVVNETGMFKHPDHDFIRANLDRLAVLPTGELVILECKTSNPFAKSVWENGVPVYYEWQGRQYLAVINAILAKTGLPPIRMVYYAALYGNTEADVIYRKVMWDPDVEAGMVEMEREFWEDHVVPKKLPDFNGTGKKLKELSISYRMELAELADSLGQELPEVDEKSGDAVLGAAEQAVYEDILARNAAVKDLKAQIRAIEEETAALEAELVSALGGNNSGILPCGVRAVLSSRASKTTDTDKLREVYPDAYAQCVSEGQTKESLTFKKPSRASVKKKAAEAAQLTAGVA